jgi:choline dehydrogenase-like flavoprotein
MEWGPTSASGPTTAAAAALGLRRAARWAADDDV